MNKFFFISFVALMMFVHGNAQTAEDIIRAGNELVGWAPCARDIVEAADAIGNLPAIAGRHAELEVRGVSARR